MTEDELRAWVFAVYGEEFGRRLDVWNKFRLQQLADLGLWEDVSETGEPIPFPKTYSIEEIGPDASMANVMVDLGIFPSLTQARKNGWNKPLVLGDHEIGKKKIRIRIVE
jgi:hypothetical protein